MQIQLPKINMAWESDRFLAFSHDYSRFYDGKGASEIEAIAILFLCILYSHGVATIRLNESDRPLLELLEGFKIPERYEDLGINISPCLFLEVERPYAVYCSGFVGKSDCLTTAIAIAVMRWMEMTGQLSQVIYDDEFLTVKKLFEAIA